MIAHAEAHILGPGVHGAGPQDRRGGHRCVDHGTEGGLHVDALPGQGVIPEILVEGQRVVDLRLMVADSPIPVHLDVAEVSASEAAVTTAYFVVAEALANALKHSGATNVDVHISAVDDRLGVAVCDDGTGGAQPGFGLTAIRDRVAALGGTFTIESTPPLGTRIEVLL